MLKSPFILDLEWYFFESPNLSMSKKSRVLKDVLFENAGINPVDNSSVNFIFRYRLFKKTAFKDDVEQLNLAVKARSDKSENLVYIPTLHQFAKIKSINNSSTSLSYNIGLVFVFIVYDALNTPILSL